MTRRYEILAGAVLLACAGGMVVSGCGNAIAQDTVKAASTRNEVRLMVYKQDFATIQEIRPVDLKEGRNRIQLDNVSKMLDPNSVIFDWAEKGDHPEIVSNTYDLGVENGGNLLKRLEGKEVDMLWHSQEGRPNETLHGTLEATRDGGFVIRSEGKLYVNPNGTIVAPTDTGMVTMPTLSAEVDSKNAAPGKMDVAYQSRGMSWSADYTARLSADGESVALECWATVENHTGVDFKDAKITLVAGSPNRATRPAEERAKSADRDYSFRSEARVPMSGSVSAFAPEAVGELYAYKVPSLASIGQEQMNRVKMISTETVPIKKDYSIELSPGGNYYDYSWQPNRPNHQNAQLAINWANDKNGGLGMPLPAGAVRVYDTNDGQAAFVGAASIGDTAKDQRVSLTLSKVFDVYTDSRIVSTKKIDKRTVQKTYEVVMHNEKSSPVDLRLTQQLYGKKKLVSETSKSRKLDASRLEWKITLQPGETKKLVYSANFGY